MYVSYIRLGIINLFLIFLLCFEEYNCTRRLKLGNDLNEINQVMQNSTRKFLNNFFNYSSSEGCEIDTYVENIFQFSFVMDNNLGDYSGCILNEQNMTYLFFIYINNDLNNEKLPTINIDDGFSDYFKDLIYTKYFLFSMCIPTCIYFNEIPRVNPLNLPNDENTTYALKIYNAQKIYQNYVHNDIKINYIIFSFYLFFILTAIFFALVPTYDIFKTGLEEIRKVFGFCCFKQEKKLVRKFTKDQAIEDYSLEVSNMSDENLKAILKRDRTEYNQIYNERTVANFSIDENETSFEGRDNSIQNELIRQKHKDINIRKTKKRNCYKFFSSIFSLSKNIRRIFKKTNTKNKTHSSYVNDNSISFVNGLKGINLICLTYCTIFWIFLQSPNSLTEHRIKENFFKSHPLMFCMLYYLYWSIYLTYAYDGFKFGYKFLCHMNHIDNSHPQMDNRNIKRRNVFKKICSFVLQQFYQYPLFVFLMLNVYNIQYLLNFTTTDDSLKYPGYGTGPLFYIYKEISNYVYEKLNYFLLLYANYHMEDTKLTKNSIFVYFFVFINEIQYFYILLIILILYYHKPSLGFYLLISAYLITMVLRCLFLNTSQIINNDIRDFFGIEVFRFHFIYGLPIYIIGVLFGTMYYEYNIVDNFEINNKLLTESFDSNSVGDNLNSSYLVKVFDNGGNRGRQFIKYFAVNLNIQVLIFTTVFLILMFFIFWDNYFLFYNIRQSGFVTYGYDSWEKIYSFLEVDFLTIFIFLFVFKFAIFKNKSFKKLLESNFWTPLSRLYYIIATLLSPLTYYIVLNLEYPILFNYSNVLFLSSSVLYFLYLLSFIISLLIEVPLKVGFKKITNKIIEI